MRKFLVCLSIAASVLAGPAAAAAAPPRWVVTQLPPSQVPPAGASGMLRGDWGDGARIVLIDGPSAPVVLTEGFDAACDPEVSFDGERLLFSGRREAGDPWNVFEMALADRSVRQVTHGPGGARRPIYLGRLYVITAQEPWDQIAFVSTRAGELDEQGGAPAADLYSARTDGTEVRRLTFNPSSDFDPVALPDGRLLFSSWQRSTLARGLRGRIALFAAQSDGLDYALFVGDEGERVKHMACVTADRLVVFVDSDRVAWDGAGRLASVSLRRNLHSYRTITRPGDGLFATPSALPGGGVLASRRPADGAATHGVVRVDPRSGEVTPVFDDPGFHDLQPTAVAPRPRPDGRSSPVSDDRPTGVLYGLDVHESDLRGRGWIEPGQSVRLRVVEGLPRRAPGPAGPTEGDGGPLLSRRLLGEVGVEPDGSFNVEVPANVPLELQLVDERGMALRSCGWIWVRNRETRGCIGCHEDGERTPENRFVTALSRPSVPLAPPAHARRTVEFERDVAPIVAARCATAGCHAGADAALDAIGRYVDPGRARTSPLVWHLFGADTSRPWDDPIEEGPPRRMPPAGAAGLTEEERRTIVEWIDLGARWQGAGEGGSP